VLADGVVIGRNFKANAGPVGSAWMWTLASHAFSESGWRCGPPIVLTGTKLRGILLKT
jgi:hypothetical protein